MVPGNIVLYIAPLQSGSLFAPLLHCSPATLQHDFKGLGQSGFRALSSPKESGAHSALLFLAEFLEAWILPEGIEHWIQSEQRGSERHDCTQ